VLTAQESKKKKQIQSLKNPKPTKQNKKAR